MIITGKLFKYVYAINDAVQAAPAVICANDMTEADKQLFMHAARQAHLSPGTDGVHVRILAATEIDVESL